MTDEYGTLVKVKQTLKRHGQALRTPGVSSAQILRQSTHEGGKVVIPTHWPPLPPRKYFWYSFLLQAETIKQPLPMTPSRIEPATFRFVGQCLNQLRHRVPLLYVRIMTNMWSCCKWRHKQGTVV